MSRVFSVTLMLASLSTPAWADVATTETVYVETPFDSDADGRMDRIYVSIDRPTGATGVHSILTMSPYALGGNDVPFHNVNVTRLPQEGDAGDAELAPSNRLKSKILDDGAVAVQINAEALERGYAALSAHSIGTGRSTGCPTVGDDTETLAAKAVIDWLGGRARAFTAATGGTEVMATWASGNVGMTGVSYNGTLPNMVATTGVEGLKAIVPVAAISNWYDYYRANGLVVGPGGYVGEDADILGKFIVRGGGICVAAMTRLTQTMGREHGDFHPFWQERDYIARAAGVRAAVFIMHGQSDWNVRQRHAIEWWEALQGQVPLRMWLHKGGHSHPSRSDTSAAIWAWFDRYVKGVDNGVEDEPAVEVEAPNGTWTTQTTWPSETTQRRTLHLNANHALGPTAGSAATKNFVDAGKTTRFDAMLVNPTQDNAARLAFVTSPLSAAALLSGTPTVTLDLAVLNRSAANLTIAIVDYDASGRGKIVTRGWADPQNHADLTRGVPLVMRQRYVTTFDLEPKQYTFARGNRIGVVVAATDFDHTLRPDNGTEISVALGESSFIALDLSGL